LYNGFDFGLVRLEEQSIEPVYDDTGKDLLFQRISMRISGILNPFMTSSGKNTNLPAGGYKEQGDRFGIAVDKLKDLLSAPRQDLQVYSGPNDLIYDCPGTGSGLLCDPDGGPIPGPLNVHDVMGDKTAHFSWSITFAVSQCGKYLLSNRWTQSSNLDSEGMAVRTIQGTAIFRADYLYDEGITPDDFRKYLVLPCPPNLRRWSINVSISADNTRATYTVQDRQIGYGVGQFNILNIGSGPLGGTWPPVRAGITRIEGNITVGAETGSDFAERLAAFGGGSVGAVGLGARLASRALSATVGTIVGTRSPPVARAVVRVYANQTIGGDKDFMAKAALAVIFDRLRPAGAGGADASSSPMLSLTVDQDIGSDNAPSIELRCSFLCLNTVALSALIDPSGAGRLMNTSSSFTITPKPDGTPGSITLDINSSTPTLPASNNTRGRWLGEMVIAALNETACEVPQAAGPVIPDPVSGRDGGYGIQNVSEPPAVM
jgi:hypothetical protein